jgi:hypothetical protein
VKAKANDSLAFRKDLVKSAQPIHKSVTPPESRAQLATRKETTAEKRMAGGYGGDVVKL